MKRKSYFTLPEWAIIVSMAIISALINTYIPIKSITQDLGIPGPAAGMALFGGFIFVLWICLARKITKKRYAGIIAAILVASFCLFIRPWYGVVSPSWFSFYGVLALFILGVWMELLRGDWEIIGGGLGNLFCLGITWLAIGFHAHVWISPRFLPVLIVLAFISGVLGVLAAKGMIRIYQVKK